MYQRFIRRWVCGFGLAAALVALPFGQAQATPVIDGQIDAEYTKVASSPKDNLNTNGVDVLGAAFNDQTNPVAHTLDVTDLWAANTASDLYIFVEMPYLDLDVISGEWALVMHCGGANDTLERTGNAGDPYGAPIGYGQTPFVNAVIKSNMAGFKHGDPNHVGFDGNQGYAFLNSINWALDGWTWDTGNFLFNKSWTDDKTNGVIHGLGNEGGEIVYKSGKGIEIKIPLGLFAANAGNTPMKAPKLGDTIKMQFYDNVRYYSAADVADEKYPRGPTDAVPFEDGVFAMNSLQGYLTTWAPYTLKAPAALEVTGARLTSATDTTHLYVSFTAPVGSGADNTANFSVVNTATGAAVPVTSAALDPNDNTRAILGLDLPLGTTLRVTVSNVQGSNGAAISDTKNTADVVIGTGVVFNLHDPFGDIARLGNDPTSGQPYTITVPGDFNNWYNTPDGAGEIVMSPVAGETGHFRSPIIVRQPGLIGYKYRVPTLVDMGNYDAWNALNPNDRRLVIPPSTSVFEVNDDAAGPYNGESKTGGSVQMTFTVLDLDNKVNGRKVYVTGTWNGWATDPFATNPAVELQPVAGKPNTYSGTFAIPEADGQGITAKYKYLIVDDMANVDWNTLNPNGEWNGDHWILIHGTGTPLAQTVEDIVGSKAIRVSRMMMGVSQAPGWAGYWRELDADLDGKITMADAIRALRP